jgi:organic hydroperoxide reductase OsmC/OhrA
MMHPYPHVYTAAASARPEGTVVLTSPSLPEIATAPPPEFDGPGDVWSPETLLCASLADCFVLSFRAIARASKLEWSELECRVEGVLERVDDVTQFTGYTTFASLKVPPGFDAAKARRLLDKAEHLCLISNSLRGKRTLVAEVLHSS